MLNLAPFYSFIKQHALFESGCKILLAVSGGRDSVLMVHYFKQAGLTFGIAHCNFKLRGDEADAEEQFTSELAEDLDVPFYTTYFDTAAYASEHGISIQMAARELRYSWLEEIRVDFGYDYVALAHHQSDAVETVLLNLTRGTGISGLHGILPKRGRLIRPLLFLSRPEIDHIIDSEGFEYRDDSSNQSSKYARNKIRLKVVPVLKELNPRLDETFKANALRFAELEELLNQRVDELREKLFISNVTGEINIPVSKLKELRPLQTLVYGLFSPYHFTEAVLKDLLNSLDKQPGKVFDSATHRISLDRGQLILSRKDRVKPAELLIPEEEGEFYWNNELYRSYVIPGLNPESKFSNTIVQLDQNMLKFPLRLRTWMQGDYFYPFGMKGKKKISDYFIDQKIPRQLKDNIGILENGNGDIVWVAGHRSDDRYKIGAACKKIFILEKVAADASEQSRTDGK
ncbi:tRNA lysidine(34) synthetase TilS [Flavihumibacter sp. R14]|nr:tRNA lysidine(34) synthetase TilS [Flavihumibacter soli]